MTGEQNNHTEHLFSDFPPFRAATDNMELWPDLLSNQGNNSARIVLLTHIRLVTLFEFVNPETHAAVSLEDLIDRARTDWGAFQALQQLAKGEEAQRFGTPNAALVAWIMSHLDGSFQRPSKKKGKRPHMVARGVFLATLIAHAERNGFRPHRNKAAKQELNSSGFEIVEAALRRENWEHVPSVSTLEAVWGDFKDFVSRSTEEKEKRALSEFGVHPESLLAMMARYPSEKFD